MPDRVSPRSPSVPPPGRRSIAGATPSEAHAPYNFVPLPERVMLVAEPPPGDRFHDGDGRYSGHLGLTIETETPLYLRGTVGAEQLAVATPSPDFFAPTGRPAIPGSSLRGMLRTLVEIVGASAFDTDYDKGRRFAYRTVADSSSPLGQVYRRKIGAVYAGHLERGRDGLHILPAPQVLGQRFWQVKKDVLQGRLGLDVEQNQFSRVRVHFEPTDRRCGKNSQLCCVDQVQAAQGDVPPHWLAGWLILSGYIEKKSHAWIIADPAVGVAPLPVPDTVLADYRRLQEEALQEAVASVSAVDRFPLLPGDGERLPCFYTVSTQHGKQVVSAFGHTRWFRLNYERSVGDAVPLGLRPQSNEGDERQVAGDRPEGQRWDLARAIFGRIGAGDEARAGRIFVEDAPLAAHQPEPFLPVAPRQILATPKLTTVQHYLDPRADGQLQHWDAPQAQVRGYKLYWHRPNAVWQEPEGGPKAGQVPAPPPVGSASDEGGGRRLATEPIRPIAPHQTFQGRVRFENLTAVELGALLFALDLPEGCRHRLGQGKPLGLGSVHVSTQLHLDDRVARYQRLFTGGADGHLTWAAPPRQGGPDKEACRRDFALWLLHGETGQAAVGDDPVVQVWRLPRLQALQALLDWGHAPSVKATSYMRLEPVNEYNGRPVLPGALEVYGGQRLAQAPRGPAADAPSARPQQRPASSEHGPPTSPPPVGKGGGPAPGGPPRPMSDAGRGRAQERPPVADAQPGSGPPTAEDLRRQFQRPTPSSGAPPKRESPGEKARREQRELLDRLRRGDQPDR